MASNEELKNSIDELNNSVKELKSEIHSLREWQLLPHGGPDSFYKLVEGLRKSIDDLSERISER